MARTPLAAVVALALGAAACAHAPEPPPVLPTPQPPNARARLYADCLGEAAAAGTYERFGGYLRLTCHGAPAEALFTGMEAFARSRDLISMDDGVEARGFTKRAWDDRCFRSAVGGASCRLTMPVGSFLDPAKDTPPPDPKRK